MARDAVGEESGPDLVRADSPLDGPEVSALVGEIAPRPPTVQHDVSRDELVPLINVGVRVFSPGRGRAAQPPAAVGVNVLGATDPRSP